MCSSHIGSLVRSHVPFDVVNWSKVSDEVKSYVMNKVLDDFNLDYDWPEDRNTVMSTMNTAYMTHRNRIHQYYALFSTKEEVLEHPVPNMKKKNGLPSVNYLVLNNFRKKMEALQLQHEYGGRLEEAKMEIEEIRARQKKKDKVFVRQAEIERAMREQQQHLMEQKQHLEEQQRKQQAEQEKRLQLLQAQMHEQMIEQ
ncbi:hypothetical protein CJ030_MR4G008610 [Morella rubra]|uniref:Uncharacterized protein n=1 Tax=Morella rubra TaxID=262757 RepID=A0A6A1VUP4_9ROSI|nr:hypothetical protein CJ030_MR4G008610 [Morella rubra]